VDVPRATLRRREIAAGDGRNPLSLAVNGSVQPVQKWRSNSWSAVVCRRLPPFATGVAVRGQPCSVQLVQRFGEHVLDGPYGPFDSAVLGSSQKLANGRGHEINRTRIELPVMNSIVRHAKQCGIIALSGSNEVGIARPLQTNSNWQ